jgi:excisionase family DNA binding protein
MTRHPAASPDLLTPAAAAAALFVDPKTVTRWARAGKIHALLTPGGHHRFLRSDVLAFLDHLRADARTQRSPRPEVSRPGSAAAAGAAATAEVRAVFLQARADAAAEAVTTATRALATATRALATAKDLATTAAATARQGRALADAHAAYADHSDPVGVRLSPRGGRSS